MTVFDSFAALIPAPPKTEDGPCKTQTASEEDRTEEALDTG
jgi:hypothetical protein